MTSKIKVDNINKVSDDSNIIKKCGSTITIGSCGASVALASGATQTGFGRTGTVDWCGTIYTNSPGTVTAVSGKGYFLNTTSGAITINLPSSPSVGDIISIKDYANTFDSNAVTVGRGGSKLAGLCIDATLGTEGQSITLIYADSTQGWLNVQTDSTIQGSTHVEATGGTESTCGDYKIHTFTSSGNFQVTAGGSPGGSNTVEYLVVAGGGASGADSLPSGTGGGGGGGGFRFASPSIAPLTYPAKPLAAPANIPVSTQTYPITVGAGGAAVVHDCLPAARKGNDSVFSTITSTGGGGGGIGNPATAPGGYAGGPGGSGGGATGEPAPGAPGGTGNTPPVSPAQGTNGGLGADGSPSTKKGAGAGGGASAAGGNATLSSTSGVGGAGAGLPTAFGSNGDPCGSYRYYSGGGGGGLSSAMPTGGAGGVGGGGNAGNPGPNPAHSGQAGTANTGGGGGGNKVCADSNGQAGGSGIVVIRYKYQN